jgi:catechol 2,3-dioxygenase-like lactoylglutathione lyase family enzyme
MPMLHHLSIAVSDLDHSAEFYDAVLAELGYERVWTDARAIGYGTAGSEDMFALKLASAAVPVPAEGFHIAFCSGSRDAVTRFYHAALANGGIGNGAPGLRPAYGQHYFAAFVMDPDGYRIEAVRNGPDSVVG